MSNSERLVCELEVRIDSLIKGYRSCMDDAKAVGRTMDATELERAIAALKFARGRLKILRCRTPEIVSWATVVKQTQVYLN